MDTTVGVSGYGIVCSTGVGVPAFKDALIQGITGIRFWEDRVFPGANIGAPLKDFSFANSLTTFTKTPDKFLTQVRKLAQRQPLTIQASLIAALEAWFHANLFEEPANPSKIGLVVAGNNIGQNDQYNSFLQYQKEPSFLTPSYALSYLDTNHVGIVSEAFGIKGMGCTIGGASASGNVAIAQAYQQIKNGLVDISVVVGALVDLSPVELQAFHNIGALGGEKFKDNPEKACRPFDRDRNGFIYGQGSGCLILESEASAIKRGVPLLGKIRGVALSLDGNHLSNPTVEGEINVMKAALSDAKISSSDVDYINAHATASTLGDETEVQAIKELFAADLPKIWINSTKSITGHCLGAAGTVEAIATLLQIKEGFVHPNLNLENPIDNDCRFAGRTKDSAKIEIAMKNGFGFGGINTSIIFERWIKIS